MKKTLFITGANRGIGLEFVRQYLADGWDIVATCRKPGGAEALNKLADGAGNRLEILALDVADEPAIAALGEQLKGRPIDLLLNNAGVYGPQGRNLGQLDAQDWLDVLRINCIAPLQVTGALQENLRAGSKARAIGISSRMGSIADNSSGGSYIYRSSKAALNAALKSAAIELHDAGVCVAILHPGWVATDMGGPNALIDATKSVAGMREVIDGLTLDDSGGFFSYDGSRIPW